MLRADLSKALPDRNHCILKIYLSRNIPACREISEGVLYQECCFLYTLVEANIKYHGRRL